MSQFVAKARERYAQCRHEAFRSCEAELAPAIGVSFILSEYSGRALAAVQAQWEPYGRNVETAWDWHEIMRRHRDPDRLDMAIWSDNDRLCGLGLALTTGDAVAFRFLEGDPRDDCPLIGKRALIARDTCARYAQGRGRAELRVFTYKRARRTLI